MRKSGAVIALLSAVLLVLAMVTPAAARNPIGEAWGTVTWVAANWTVPGLSTFTVRDGSPGQASSRGDRGTYRLSFPDSDRGALTLDVKCVRVDAGWAEFAGVVTEATGVYVLGEVFRVSVKDGGQPNGGGDEIGMKSHGFDLAAGCATALDASQLGRKGIISAGDITVRLS